MRDVRNPAKRKEKENMTPLGVYIEHLKVDLSFLGRADFTIRCTNPRPLVPGL